MSCKHNGFMLCNNKGCTVTIIFNYFGSTNKYPIIYAGFLRDADISAMLCIIFNCHEQQVCGKIQELVICPSAFSLMVSLRASMPISFVFKYNSIHVTWSLVSRTFRNQTEMV